MAFRDPKTYDLWNFVTLFLGVWLGVVPLIAKALGRDEFRIAVTLLLPGPLDVIAAIAAVVAMMVAFVLLDRSKRRAGSLSDRA